MRSYRFGLLLALITQLMLSGCMMGPNFSKPRGTPPKAYASHAYAKKTVTTADPFGQAQHFITEKKLPKAWWTLFHSKPLNKLIAASLKNNPDVAGAKAALKSSLEAVYAQRGAFYPYVGLSMIPSDQQTAGVMQSNLANNTYLYSLYTGQLFVSYTFDVFGAIKRQAESLLAQAEFQRFELEATYLTLTTNVVNAAIQQASAREKIKVTQQIIASQKQLLTIYQQRHTAGDASQADIAMQQAALAATEATLPPLTTQFELQRDLLTALAGQYPDNAETPTFRFTDLTLPTEIPLALPSHLVEHRPDIRAVEAQLHAANALIGIAVANRLPNVTLGVTNLGVTTTSLSRLFAPNTHFWDVAGIITQPIFDAGTLMHKQRIAEANYLQAATLYRATVINAFQSVADALKTLYQDALALHAASDALRAARKSLTIARNQLQGGDVSSTYVLQNELLYQQAKLNLVQAQTNRLADTVALFQALGGGWC